MTSGQAARTIAEQARAENPLWGAALRDDPEWEPVFSALAPERYALGIETIYEAYLVHYGHSRLFVTGEEGERVLLGDYLYAHGLVRVAQAGGVEAVAVMADLISRCAALRAEAPGAVAEEGEAWVAASRALGGEPPAPATAAALARHHGHLVGSDVAPVQGRIPA